MRRALAALLLLGGCIGPRGAAPPAAAIAPPPAWRGALGPGSAIAVGWWRGFGDPVLADLVARALAANQDIAIAAARVEEARATARFARAQRFPQVNLSAGGAYARDVSTIGTPELAFSAEPELAASFDIDLFGRLRAASAAARAQALASEASRDTVRLAIATQVASGYINLRALDQRLAVARQTLAARAEALRIARRRADTGYTSRLEYNQALGEYRATEQLVPQAQLLVTRQEDALRLLLGDAPGDIPRGVALASLASPAIPDGLPADLLRRRPDLYQAEQTLVAADRSLDAARAAMLPNVALTGATGLVLSSLLTESITVFSLGGSILAPIFDAGRLRAQTDAAAARRDQAAFGYRRTALTAFREVEDALAGVRRSGEQATALAGQRDALAAALRNASNRYRAGYSSYLDQLDAQRGLLSAELALVQAQSDRLTAYAALYQAMGGGWSPQEVQATGR